MSLDDLGPDFTDYFEDAERRNSNLVAVPCNQLKAMQEQRNAQDDRIMELELALCGLVDSVKSKVGDHRDLLEELNPAGWHYCDINVRKGGKDWNYEGDWLKGLWYALRNARKVLGR